MEARDSPIKFFFWLRDSPNKFTYGLSENTEETDSHQLKSKTCKPYWAKSRRDEYRQSSGGVSSLSAGILDS